MGKRGGARPGAGRRTTTLWRDVAIACDDEEIRLRSQKAFDLYEKQATVLRIRAEQGKILRAQRRHLSPKSPDKLSPGSVSAIDQLGRRRRVEIPAFKVRNETLANVAKQFGLSIHTVDLYWKRGRRIKTLFADRLKADLAADMERRIHRGEAV